MWPRHGRGLLALYTFCASAAAASPSSINFKSTGNPIFANGSLYSADPGPIVVNDTLYIISGRDTAPVGDDGFVMNEWVMFETSTAKPSGGDWTIHTDFLRPHSLFHWASTGNAFASQIVQGLDSRFYMYSPVEMANTNNSDPFAIGVAVSDSILGPYTDLRPEGPIVSQSYPAPGNDIENIDPTVLVDDDGKVYMYWGTFGELRGVELEKDMMTFASDVLTVTSLDGFFEAAWLMKRHGTYYLLYADNSVGTASKCTPTLYHACIAYGTSSSPMGPWTYQGVILGIVSSTTSHSGALQFKGEYYLIYHDANAKNGGNFRRSLAWDKMEFNDTTSPPTIVPVVQTFRPSGPPKPTRNREQLATVTTNPVPQIQYWDAALNDQLVPLNPLPPQYWCSYASEKNKETSVLTYHWNETVTLNGTSMVFFADHDAGSVIGVAPPTSWSVEYLTAQKTWTPVKNHTAYPLEVTNSPAEVPFDKISTKGLRATLKASTNGTYTAGVGVVEWFALAPTLSTV